MIIREIELKDFRNYKNLQVSFSEDINIFLGENAQGKTNLLEGIYLNAMAKSFKTIREKEMIRFGEDYCRIKTKANYSDDDHLIEIAISREGAKAITVDGVKIRRTSELLDKVHIIIFSPEDLKIVKDEPTKRRNFIDREICQIRPRYVSDLNQYRRALKQRNACLFPVLSSADRRRSFLRFPHHRFPSHNEVPDFPVRRRCDDGYPG